MVLRWLASVAVSLVLLMVSSTVSYAQGHSGGISGTVTDENEQVVPAAEVTAVNVATGRKHSAATDESGSYLLINLPVGTYSLSAAKTGFKTASREGIVLLVDQQLTLNIQLTVGAIDEMVRIETGTVQVDTTSGTLAEVVTEKQITELPLNGRNVQQLVAIQAGVLPTNRQYFFNQVVAPSVQFFAVSGAPGNSINYILEGSDHNDTWTNVSMPTPNPDALKEFSVQTNNFGAEYGSKAGGVVNMVIKSGTNSFHGSAFWFHRNYALNARNFFAATNDGLKRNQYGGTIGGPIIREKTFFFFSYQGTKLRQTPSSLVAFVPTAAQRAGDLSGLAAVRDPLTGLPFPNNQIPQNRLDPTMQSFLQRLVPLPNGPNGRLTFSQRYLNDVNEIIARGDQSLGSKDSLYVSFFNQKDKTPPTGTANNAMSLVQGALFSTRKLVIGETHVFSSSLINEFRLSFGKTDTQLQSAATAADNFEWQDIGMLIPKVTENPTFIEFSSPLFNVNSGFADEHKRRQIQVSNHISIVSGKHEMKFGGDFIRSSYSEVSDFRVDGLHSFSQNRTGSPYGDLLLGLPDAFTQLNPTLNKASRNLWSVFAQDRIRVVPRLTLTLGLRYEPYLNWRSPLGVQASNAPGQQSTLYPNLPPGVLVLGDPGVPKNGINNDWSRFAPRFGFAYDVFGDGKTSVRGGYGIFYETLSNAALSNFPTMQPFTTAVAISQPFSFTDPYRGQVNPFPAPNPAPATQPLARPLGTVYLHPADYKPPHIQQWNLAVERDLPWQFLARAAYVGSHGSELTRNRDFNAAVYIPGQSTTGNRNQRRPNRGYQIMYISEAIGRSNYNSMQLTVERRFIGGWTMKANYTLAKSLDDAPQTTGGQHQNRVRNPLGDPDIYGPSDFDRRHRFVSTMVWQIPAPFEQAALRHIFGGWELSGILTAMTGSPFTIVSAGDPSLSGAPAYADIVPGCDPNDVAGGRSIDRWFNTSCFRNAATGTFGNLGRNTGRAPGLNTLDLGLYRNFRVRENLNVQFRSEFFNIFNHTNFNSPNASLASPAAFGRITSASDPRIVQLALKIVF